MTIFAIKKNYMEVKQRDSSWDFVKLILMFLIVFGHFCPAGKSWTPVTRIVGLCAIPGFFFISGYFQSRITNFNDLFAKYLKSLKRIMVPMLSWGVIYVILNLVQLIFLGDISDVYGILQFLKYSPFYVAGIYWFLTALLFCIIIGSLFSWVIYKNEVIGFLLTALSTICFCFVSPFFMERYHFSFIWFFYVAGMLYKHLGGIINKYKLIPWDYIFILLFIIVVVYGMQFIPQFTFYYTSNIIGDSSLCFVIFRFVFYLIATITVIYGINSFYYSFKEKPIISQFASYGGDTLFVYCSHVLVLVFIYRPIVLSHLYCEQGSWINRINELIVGIIVSLLIYFLMQKLCLYSKHFRLLRVLFMGTY